MRPVYKNVSEYQPTNVAFAPDGGFYVGDGYGSHYIHQYDKDAKWVRTWGGPGKAPGKLSTPHGLCVLSSNWKVVWANRSLSKIFSPAVIPTHDLIGESFDRRFVSCKRGALHVCFLRVKHASWLVFSER